MVNKRFSATMDREHLKLLQHDIREVRTISQANQVDMATLRTEFETFSVDVIKKLDALADREVKSLVGSFQIKTALVSGIFGIIIAIISFFKK